MATEVNNLNITIRIADVEPIALTIPSNEEEGYREAEKLVNTLWNKWIIGAGITEIRNIHFGKC